MHFFSKIKNRLEEFLNKYTLLLTRTKEYYNIGVNRIH